MKNLFILIGLVFVVNCYSQRENILSFSYAPGSNEIGLIYISKPIFSLQKDYKLYSSFEYGNYKLIERKVSRIGLGFSTDIDSRVSYNFAISINIEKSDTVIISYTSGGITTNVIPVRPITSEMGLTFQISQRTYLTIMSDLIHQAIFYNNFAAPHFKFGLGYKF